MINLIIVILVKLNQTVSGTFQDALQLFEIMEMALLLKKLTKKINQNVQSLAMLEKVVKIVRKLRAFGVIQLNDALIQGHILFFFQLVSAWNGLTDLSSVQLFLVTVFKLVDIAFEIHDVAGVMMDLVLDSDHV